MKIIIAPLFIGVTEIDKPMNYEDIYKVIAPQVATNNWEDIGKQVGLSPTDASKLYSLGSSGGNLSFFSPMSPITTNVPDYSNQYYGKGVTASELDQMMAPITALQTSGQYRDIPSDIIPAFFSGQLRIIG